MKKMSLWMASILTTISAMSFADATLPAQKITAIDTDWNSQGVIFSFRDGVKLEGCNSNQVLIENGPLLDGILSIGLSAHFANRKVQIRVAGCSNDKMLGKAISLSDYYDAPGTHYTIASNLTQVNLASLVDPNSASIFYITIDHNTRLKGASGVTGATGVNGSKGINGNSFIGGRDINGGTGGTGGNGDIGGIGGEALDLAGFSGKKVTIINNGIIEGGNGGNGGNGGGGGIGGIGANLVGDHHENSGRCSRPSYTKGGAGGKGGTGGTGGNAGVAIINIVGIDLILKGNPSSQGIQGNQGDNGKIGNKGANGQFIPHRSCKYRRW